MNNILKTNKMDLLISIYIFCIISSELLGIKTFPLLHIGTFKLNASVGIFLIPFIFSINDAIIEVYGASRAKSVYRSGLLTIILLFIFTFFAINLPPSERFRSTQKAYTLIFGQSIRIALASLSAFALSDFIDIMIFDVITKKIGSRALWFRNNISNIISELFDTVIFMTLSFWAIDKSINNNLIFLTSLILPYWLLKCFMSIIETPFVYIVVKWLKNESK